MRKILFLLFIMCCTVELAAQSNFKQLRETGKTAPIPVRMEKGRFTKQAIQLYNYSRMQQSKFVKRVRNANVPADKAEIILESHDPFGYGIGYQMLLDENHNTYGELFDGNSYVFGDSYDEFEYKIPEDAETKLDTKAVIVDGEGKVLIPAGTYDYMITSPFPGDGISFAKGEFGRFDDFRFEGGYTYRFRIELKAGEWGPEDCAIPYTDVDAAVSDLLLPASSMDLTATETISVKITNRGTSAISGFPVCYQVNDGNVVTETYAGTIEPEDTVSYTFSTKADLSAIQIYTVKAYTNLPGDLIPYNDAKEGKCRHIGALSLPYTYDFSSKEDFPFDWTVINANEDYRQWEYNEWDTHSGDKMGDVYCPSYSGENDDYLLSSPIRLESGDNYLTFYMKAASPDKPELLDVRYGNTTDVETMTVIGNYATTDGEWALKAINFNVATDGVYYFAFHSKSVNAASLYLDDILIDRGVYEVSPDLSIEKILLPYSNCDLSDQSQVGARLINKGTGAAQSITLTYTVNDGTSVTQTFTETLEPDASKDYYFDTTADFLDLGKYTVTVKAESGKNADEKTASVEHYAPVTDFPKVTDFYLNAGIENYWTLMSEGTWRYEDMLNCYSCTKGGTDNGLISRCFTFNRPFRVKVAYRGGRFDTPAAFYIAYGKPGTDVSTWTKVYEDKNILGEVETEFKVDLKEFGDYSIAIVDVSEDQMVLTSLYQFTVSEIYEHDMRINEVRAPVSPYMPVNHINKEGTYAVSVENRGTGQLTGVKASVNKGTDQLFASSATSLKIEETGTLLVSGTLPVMTIGSKVDLNVKVEAAETDSYMDDNTWMLPTVNATDTVFATEQTNEFILGMGLFGQTANFGNVYTLAETDTLTSVSVGLSNDDWYTAVDMGVAVYSLKADGLTIDRELFSTTFERGAEGGLRNITFTPRILAPGKYYFEVRQLALNNIGLTYELAENSAFYQNVDGKLALMPNYGNIVVRANFGHDAKAYRKNVTVSEITKPVKTKALFSSVETVEAIVENAGMEAASGVVIRCLSSSGIDKTLTIDLAPYEKKTVTFEGCDFSKPGEYTLTVSATVEGDENREDDAVTRVLTALPEANPYTLDFESCDDFDTDHQFNPRWWTVDRTGLQANAFWQFKYPHYEEPVGFMAFNIEATVPAMTDELNVPGFFPHTGKRFGAAFVPIYTTGDELHVSDTWLISPKLKLNEHSSLELYVKTPQLQSPMSKLERYKLYISDTNDSFDSFRILGEERQAPEDWTKVTVDLSTYNNKEVYVALQYISATSEGVVMMVDDITVKSDGVGIDNTKETADVQLSATDGMLTLTSGSPITQVMLYDISGQQVYSSGNLETGFYRIPLTAYPAGVYMAYVQTSTGAKTLKFAVTK